MARFMAEVAPAIACSHSGRGVSVTAAAAGGVRPLYLRTYFVTPRSCASAV
jgi:hypothetical protein